VAVVRSFGISFLGESRDVSVRSQGEAPLSMRIPMAFHALFILILGLWPMIGIYIVFTVTSQFTSLTSTPQAVNDIMENLSVMLQPLSWMGALLGGVTLVLFVFRKFCVGQSVRQHVTWACGYKNVNSRMQYTGSSFSDPLVDSFRGLLRLLTRDRLPRGLFPQSASFNTHFVDAVERRVFKVIAEGEQLIQSIAARIHEESQVSFAMGLLVILVSMTLFLMKNGII
jgi:hydrogenase-4 component B